MDCVTDAEDLSNIILNSIEHLSNIHPTEIESAGCSIEATSFDICSKDVGQMFDGFSMCGGEDHPRIGFVEFVMQMESEARKHP